MKLYTEEQVLNALKLAHSRIKPLQYVVDTLTPIELPSDEDILNEVNTMKFSGKSYQGGFIEGMQWMRDKIQGGNK
jgi:hypothetical protein